MLVKASVHHKLPREFLVRIVDRVLEPACSDAKWHPFDVVLRWWKVESLLQHVVELYGIVSNDVRAPLQDGAALARILVK